MGGPLQVSQWGRSSNRPHCGPSPSCLLRLLLRKDIIIIRGALASRLDWNTSTYTDLYHGMYIIRIER